MLLLKSSVSFEFKMSWSAVGSGPILAWCGMCPPPCHPPPSSSEPLGRLNRIEASICSGIVLPVSVQACNLQINLCFVCETLSVVWVAANLRRDVSKEIDGNNIVMSRDTSGFHAGTDVEAAWSALVLLLPVNWHSNYRFVRTSVPGSHTAWNLRRKQLEGRIAKIHLELKVSRFVWGRASADELTDPL